MKVIIIMLLFLLSPISLFSQEKVVVDYGLVYHVSDYAEEHKQRFPDYFKTLYAMAKRGDDLSFKLNISKQQSYFTHPPVDIEDKELNMLFSHGQGSHIFFTDLKEGKILEEFNFWKVDVLVEIDTDEYPWELIDEQKTINNYVCSKAVKKINLMNGNGEEYVLNVEAWYTEEIPLQFGPKDYCGLPGLILELKEGKYTYYVKKIDYNGDFEAFQAPTKGIEMSLREYSENIRAIKRKGKQTFLNSRG